MGKKERNSSMKLSNCIITGANRGIGLELVRLYLESEKWKVHACCRHVEGADSLNALKQDFPENLEIHPLDVTRETSIRDFSLSLKNERIDLLLNNAGIMGGDRQTSLYLDFDQWREAFDVNTMAPLRMLQAVISNLRQSELPKVVTISSQMGSLAREGRGSISYRSTKAALNKVMQVVSLELKEEGITVALIHPGWVRTDMGGSGGDISVEESANGIMSVIASLTISDTGRFLKWTGEDHPW